MMMLRIDDFYRSYDTSESMIDKVLRRRYDNNANHYWISRNNQAHPVIAVCVVANLAHLTFFPSEDHPGFISMSNLKLSQPSITFYLDKQLEEHKVFSRYVVGIDLAIEAIKEFLVNGGMPGSIKWEEL